MANTERFILTDDIFNEVSQYCKDEVINGMKHAILTNSKWWNEFGYLGNMEGLDSNYYMQYESIDDFIIVLHKMYNAIFYKILPKNATNKTCRFLSDPRRFDGYFLISKFRNIRDIDNLINVYCDFECLGGTTDSKYNRPVLYNGYYICWYDRM
jgi:hypothetical protein